MTKEEPLLRTFHRQIEDDDLRIKREVEQIINE